MSSQGQNFPSTPPRPPGFRNFQDHDAQISKPRLAPPIPLPRLGPPSRDPSKPQDLFFKSVGIRRAPPPNRKALSARNSPDVGNLERLRELRVLRKLLENLIQRDTADRDLFRGKTDSEEVDKLLQELNNILSLDLNTFSSQIVANAILRKLEQLKQPLISKETAKALINIMRKSILHLFPLYFELSLNI